MLKHTNVEIRCGHCNLYHSVELAFFLIFIIFIQISGGFSKVLVREVANKRLNTLYFFISEFFFSMITRALESMMKNKNLKKIWELDCLATIFRGTAIVWYHYSYYLTMKYLLVFLDVCGSRLHLGSAVSGDPDYQSTSPSTPKKACQHLPPQVPLPPISPQT